MKGDKKYLCKVKGCKKSFFTKQQLGGHMSAHRSKGEYGRNKNRKGTFIVIDSAAGEFDIIDGYLEQAETAARTLAEINDTEPKDIKVYGVAQEYSAIPQGLKLTPKKK